MNKTFRKINLAVIFVSFSFSAVCKELHPAPIFGDNMVLQRNKTIKIWGTAKPDAIVSATLSSDKAYATADSEGHWSVYLPARNECDDSLDMVIESDSEKIVFKNILIGDVWLMSGQSNMLMRVNSLTKEDKADVLAKNDDKLRYAQISPIVEGGKVKPELKPEWTALGKGNTANWSAFAVYFAEQLRKYTQIPIGIICCAQGNSNIEAWIGKEFIEQHSLIQYCQKDYSDDRIYSHYKNMSSVYDSMLAKAAGYTLKGVVWYQGEANAKSGIAGNYGKLLNGLIDCWRELWDDQELPFGIVQLPNYGYKETTGYNGCSWAEIRQEQKNVCETTKNCMLAVTADIGENDNIHPKNKSTAGKRMAFPVLSEVYGINDVPKTPCIDEGECTGDKIVLHITGDRIAKSKHLTGFEIQDAAGEWHSASARLLGDKIIIRINEGVKANAIRYAWSNTPQLSVYSKSGIPASPQYLAF